ncbi:MAG TPA: rhodanese-like domain-containing protein [Bacteroidia bacterium]|nr:rhodanese-like domain-containing protein [Bacteroidia bacterium]
MKAIFLKTNLLIAFFSLFLLSVGCQAQQETGPDKSPATVAAPLERVQLISPAEASKLMATDARMQILDVRTPEEVADGMIKGATAINWFDADFAAKAEATFDKALPVIVYCKVGGRSAQASEVLRTRGFATVYNIQDGFVRWKSEGHPVQK